MCAVYVIVAASDTEVFVGYSDGALRVWAQVAFFFFFLSNPKIEKKKYSAIFSFLSII